MAEAILSRLARWFGGEKPIRRALGILMSIVVSVFTLIIVLALIGTNWDAASADWVQFFGLKVPYALVQLVLFAVAMVIFEWAFPGETLSAITDISPGELRPQQTELAVLSRTILLAARLVCATLLYLGVIWAVVNLIKAT